MSTYTTNLFLPTDIESESMSVRVMSKSQSKLWGAVRRSGSKRGRAVGATRDRTAVATRVGAVGPCGVPVMTAARDR